ncbi:MAG: hypothetical protein K2X77_16180 [Candidatus Obscuribacterales bacterium]|nr:hypothetical protein [Candidatus Obscuribacterales bacterium]
MNLILSISFLSFIAFFAVASWLCAPPEVLTDENRKISKLPRLSKKNLLAFPQAFEAYFNDRLFSRSELVKTRNLFRFKFWDLSDAPNILVGKNGWLYFLGETGSILTAPEKPYTQAELEQWKNVLSGRARYFEQQRRKYVFVVAPNKQSIYPEYFPLFTAKRTRLDQLSSYLGQYPDVPFINLKDPLIGNKNEGNCLYFKTDTHWNELGAFIADRYIASLLSASIPGIQPIAFSGAKISKETFSAGDCTKLMGLFGWVKESAPLVKLADKNVKPAFSKGTGYATEISTFSQAVKKGQGLRAVVFHDSFGEQIKPYLSAHFSRAAYQLRQADLAVDLDLVAAENPDLVIQEVVERHVVQLVPYPVHDWRHEILDALKTQSTSGHGQEWLCVLPHTNEVNSLRLQEVLRSPHCNVTASNCRQWTDAGVQVSFDPKTAEYFRWYVTKTGAQETSIGNSGKLADKESQRALSQLSDYVQNSGRFEVVKQIKLFDQSEVTLWKLRTL